MFCATCTPVNEMKINLTLSNCVLCHPCGLGSDLHTACDPVTHRSVPPKTAFRFVEYLLNPTWSIIQYPVSKCILFYISKKQCIETTLVTGDYHEGICISQFFPLTARLCSSLQLYSEQVLVKRWNDVLVQQQQQQDLDLSV